VRQTAGYAYDVTVADFDGDGLEDFASTLGDTELLVWLARGRGVTEAENRYTFGRGPAIGVLASMPSFREISTVTATSI
jgi:hypothetical protein